MFREQKEHGGDVMGMSLEIQEKLHKENPQQENYPIKEVETIIGVIVEVSEEE